MGDQVAVLVTTDLLCRGVDISGGVDYVIQFDPPTFAPNFVHRAGRTARAGQAGENLVLLTPSEHEQNYLEFLKLNQKVGDMVELKEEFEILELEKVRQTQLKDKRNFEYAQRAFPSFVCAYKATLEYKDKSVRVQRAMKEEERLKKRNKEIERKKKEKNKAWSDQKAAKNKKAEKRARKAKKQELIAADFEKDMKELNDDYQIMKKRKKGLITEEELEDKL